MMKRFIFFSRIIFNIVIAICIAIYAEKKCTYRRVFEEKLALKMGFDEQYCGHDFRLLLK